MRDKAITLLVVGAGPALFWTTEELKRRYAYQVHYTADPFEAGFLLGNGAVDAVLCELPPAHTAECRLLHEICDRSVRVPVFLFVEPEAEEDLYDVLARGTFHVVRPSTPLEHFHHLLESAVGLRRRAKVA